MHELLMKVTEMRLKVIFGWSVCIVVYGSIRLQTELKYPSKNRRRFTQKYNMTKIIFS